MLLWSLRLNSSQTRPVLLLHLIYSICCGMWSIRSDTTLHHHPHGSQKGPQFIRHSRHRHKNLHKDHRCPTAFDAGCNLQKHYGCYSRKGIRQEFLSTVPRVCRRRCKGSLMQIKHEDKIISRFSGVSLRFWSVQAFYVMVSKVVV